MLKTKLCKIDLKNPTILASGILGVSAASLANVANNGAGAVTSKSIGIEERKGHPAPVMITTPYYAMNAVGLSNAGIEESLPEIEHAVKISKSPIIASIFAHKINDFGILAEKISKAKPHLIEVNISCPNVEAEFGKSFSMDEHAAAKVTEIIKNNTKIPVIIKLSPNVPDITKIAKACEAVGADAINAINTVGPGIAIDIKTKKMILSNKTGGISGPAIKPIAVKAVHDIYKSVNIPIIGTGGIMTGEDAIEIMMAGATAVGIGSGVYYRGIDVFKKVNEEMEFFLKNEGYKHAKDLIGKVHDNQKMK